MQVSLVDMTPRPDETPPSSASAKDRAVHERPGDRRPCRRRRMNERVACGRARKLSALPGEEWQESTQAVLRKVCTVTPSATAMWTTGNHACPPQEPWREAAGPPALWHDLLLSATRSNILPWCHPTPAATPHRIIPRSARASLGGGTALHAQGPSTARERIQHERSKLECGARQ